MKFKKSMLILILAVFLISIAGVCASDVNDTAVASQDDAVMESTDENMITVEDSEPAVSMVENDKIFSDSADDEIVGVENDLDKLSANPGTYSGLSSEIGSGGNIALTHDYYTYDSGSTITISTNNSVIDGNGAIIDMAGSNMRAFNVTASGVTIKNLTIRNANAEGNGGAVYFNNTGVVENCNFVDNKAEFFGGAVCFGGQGTVTNCNFTDNHATSGFGGAIYFIHEGNVTDSNFINNTASGLYAGGGAIYFARDGNVTDCNFTNNKATDDQSFGGAVQIYRKGKLKNCIFVNNAAGDSGGAVLIQGDAEVTNCNFVINSAGYAGALSTFGNSYITYCNFTNNKATDGMSFGGALEFESGKLENSIFVNNSAFRGGAAYFYGNSEVTNCNFTDNKAGENAGALWFVAKSSVENCIFVNNNAKNFGGGILFYKNGEVTNCNFTNNNADVEAGGIYYYTKGEVTNCNFTDNKAGDYAGAVWFNGVGNVTNCSFVRNSASEMYGGGIFFKSDGEVTNCNFVNNNATYGGGIFFYVNGEVTDCNFTNNKVGNTGSGIFFNKNGEVTNCNFINNSAGSYAGAVYFNEGGRLINSNFTDNSAGVYAGAVHIYKNGIVENCNFNGNNAPEGGAIRIINNVTVKDCSFNDNNASKGGAVFIKEDGVVTDCNFTNNSAGSNGGAVFINEKGIVENCNFIKNSAKDGGALFINGTAGVTNCNFTDNKVNETQGHGGAIYWNGTNGNVSDCSFVNNSGYNGGTICWNGTDGVVSGCSFVNNSAMNAAAIWWQANDGVVSGCSFVNNSATDHGGAILWCGDNGNVSGCSFVNNYVKYYGGSIFWNGTAGGLVSDCSFVNNYGYNGGALFLDAGAGALVSDCTFANNLANWGGAIFCDSCVGDVVSGCSFVNNTAGVGGAVCWWSSNEGLVHDCSFVNNSVRYYGAAIYWRGNDGKVSGCSFVNNSKYSTIYFYNNENISHNLSINDNIFLNNTGVVIYFVNNDSSSNADYNWFGNNATNYDMAPTTNNMEINTWLFLNATANPDPIPITDTSDIIFKLYAYTPNGVSEYDNTLLKAVNLTLTPTNGRVNTNRTNIGEPVQYTPESIGIGTLTASIENATYTVTLINTDGTTFADLNWVINGNNNDTIVLDRDYTYNPTFDYDFKNGIVIDRPVTIIGNGHTLNATGLARIFNIQANDVTIKNITFTNAKNREDGGAVYFENSGTVENCNFTNNTASNGGAVYFFGQGTVTNCNFTNNSAISVDTGGGALFMLSGTVTNCNFTNNTASYDGGAVYFYENGEVTNCNFTKNNARSHGGALYFDNGYCKVTSCIFVNNVVEYSGGALYFYNGGEITNCNFTNNQATGVISWAGAIDMSSGNITNCNFVNNSAINGNSGAIDMLSGNIANCNFVNNTASNGGAVELRDYGEVTNCNFTNNSAFDYGGGAIDLYSGNITNCNFVNNKATDSGAIYFYEYGEVTNCNFINNSGDFGGAVSFVGSGKLSNSNFTNNFGGHGGAVYINKGIVENCNFTNNTASSEGGAVIIINDGGVVTDCNFINNSATLSGGAIYVHNATDVVVSGSVFVNNSGDNGTIYFNNEEYGSNFTINDNIFLNNDGVAIYFAKNDSTSNADYNWFGNNVTNYDIGPVTNNVEISTWLFLNATANPDAIIILGSFDIVFKLYAYNSSEVSEYDNGRLKAVRLTLTPTNGRVNTTRVELGEPVHYTAEGAGIGTLTASIEDATYTTTLKIIDGTFFELNRTINGNDNDTIVLDKDYSYNSTFDYNLTDGIVIDRPLTIIGNGHTLDATGLARIFNVQADNVTIENITFINAKAERTGGAIYWTGVNGVVSDCDFVNNSANYAAAIWWDGAYGVVSDCDFINNSAYAAGAIWWYAHHGALSSCIFVNNSAESSGGAILWDGANSNVSDCIFVNNTADSAGAIDWSNQYGVISGCSFVNNSANNAGAIRWTTNNGVVTGCSFVNNSAADGIIYFGNKYYGSNLSINDNIFLNNEGVAIYFEEIDSTSNADYNWFGNNATNYDVAPTTTNVELGTWLFLNATVDPDLILVSELSEIIFELYSYNATGVSDYDDSQLYPINLTVTATNGVADGIAKLGETVKYNATVVGKGSVTAKIENAEYTSEIMIIKRNSNLSVESQEVTYSNNAVIALNYNSSATGKVNITLNGKKSNYTFTDLDLNGTISLGDVGADEYDVTVVYSGDDNFLNATVTGDLTVNKATAEIILVNETLELYVGNFASDFAYIAPAGAGDLAFVSSDEGVIIVASDVSYMAAYGVGTATVTVSFAGNDNYEPAKNKTITVNVILKNSSVSVENSTLDLKVGDRYDLNATSVPDLLNIEYKSSDESIATVNDYGIVTAVGKGTAIITLTVGDNITYAVNSTNVTVKVSRADAFISVAADDITYGEDLLVNVTLSDDVARRAIVTVDNETKLVSLVDGKGSVKFTGLAAGAHTVVASYNGDVKYLPVSTNTTVNVKRAATEIEIFAHAYNYGYYVVVDVVLPEDVSRRAIVTIGNETKLVSLTNGQGSVKFSGLDAGTYTVVAAYNGDVNYKKASVNTTIVVAKAASDIKVTANPVSYGEDVVVEVVLPENVSRRAVVTLGNETKYVSLVNGVGSVKFSGLAIGSYDVVASYNGDENYIKSSVSAVAKVTKAIPEIQVSAGDISVGEALVVDVQLPRDVTKRASVAIGNESKFVSLKDGIGSVKFTGLEVGIHDVVVSYVGDANYRPSSNTTTIEVKE